MEIRAMRWHVWCVKAAVVAAGWAGLGAGWPAEGSGAALASGQPALVVLDPVRVDVVERWQEVTGELRPARRALVATEEEGLVVAIEVVGGDTVQAGQVLARLRDVGLRLEAERAGAELAHRRAALAEREAAHRLARRELERLEEAAARGAAVESELEDRRLGLAAAEARVRQAQAEVDAATATWSWARTRLERANIRAPFAGVVVARRTELGQWVRAGDPVAEILALDELDAFLNVPESYVDRLAPGTSVRLRLVATGTTIEVPVAALIPEADPRSRLFPVRIRVVNEAGRLRPGMSVVALIPTGQQAPMTTVRRDAIRRDDAGEFVFYDAGGTAQVARVRTLFPTGERVAVESGVLREGMMTIVEGNERLSPGQPITPLPSHPADSRPDGASRRGERASPGAGQEGSR